LKRPYIVSSVPYPQAVHSGVEIESGVQHPNQYFQESRKALGLGVHSAGGGAIGKAL